MPPQPFVRDPLRMDTNDDRVYFHCLHCNERVCGMRIRASRTVVWDGIIEAFFDKHKYCDNTPPTAIEVYTETECVFNDDGSLRLGPLNPPQNATGMPAKE